MHVIGALISFFFYFLPTIIAYNRKHPRAGSILLLNFFLGWSIIGWCIALVWALRDPQPVQVIAVPVPAGAGFCTHCGAPATGVHCSRCGNSVR
jgi:Superinfection immunity protein